MAASERIGIFRVRIPAFEAIEDFADPDEYGHDRCLHKTGDTPRAGRVAKEGPQDCARLQDEW